MTTIAIDQMLIAIADEKRGITWAVDDRLARLKDPYTHVRAAYVARSTFRWYLDDPAARAFLRLLRRFTFEEGSYGAAVSRIALAVVSSLLVCIGAVALAVMLLGATPSHSFADRGASMNAQQEAVALWKYIESRGAKPTHRTIAVLLRAWDIRFRDSDLTRWLAPFRKQAGNAIQPRGQQMGNESAENENENSRAVSRPQTGNAIPSRGQQTGNGRETASREKVVPLVSNNSPTATAREDLAAWFFARGQAVGAIGLQWADARAWVRREADLDAADALLANYPRAEIEARAERLFGLKVAGKIYRPVTIGVLRDHWDSADVAGSPGRPSVSSGAPATNADREKALDALDPGVAGVLRRLPR